MPDRIRQILMLALALAGCATAVPPERAERDAMVLDVARECITLFPGISVIGVDPQGQLITRVRNESHADGFRECFGERMRETLKQRTLFAAGRLVVPPGAASSYASPLRAAGRNAVVTVLVNGANPASLMLDTGASMTVFTPRAAERLGITVPEGAPRLLAIVVGGRTISIPYVRVKSLGVGHLVVQDIDVGVQEVMPHEPALDGLLGGNFLQHFRLTVDREATYVVFDASGSAATGRPATLRAASGVWTSGDEWHFRWATPVSSGTFVRSVEGEETVEGTTYYVVRMGSQALYYLKPDLGLHFVKAAGTVVTRWEPSLGYWPPKEGAVWEVIHRAENARERQTTSTVVRCAAVDAPTITVAAGTFATIHVACRDQGDRRVFELWYAPAVAHWVKEWTITNAGDRWQEMTSYRKQPK